MKHSSAIILVLLSLFSIHAVPPQQVTWTQYNSEASVAQSYTYKLYVSEESGRQSVYTLLNTLCGGALPNTQCSTALPSAANVAIISGNQSSLTVTDPTTNIESAQSLVFIGNQGCIFRNNLYAISKQAVVESNKGQVNNVLNEFKAAKFKLISQVAKGARIIITEECVGYIVQ